MFGLGSSLEAIALLLVLIAVSLYRAVQFVRFMHHRRWRWTIADWFLLTFYLGFALLVFRCCLR